jgi:hypothetical protein
MLGVERFPIGFKSVFNGHAHRHVVLGIYHGGRYGALGMSRRDELMYKPMTFKVSTRQTHAQTHDLQSKFHLM